MVGNIHWPPVLPFVIDGFGIGHLLLLLLPLVSLSSKHGSDPIFLSLRLVHICSAIWSSGVLGLHCDSGCFGSIAVLRVDWRSASDISGSSTVTRASGRKSTCDYRRGAGNDGGVVVIFFIGRLVVDGEVEISAVT